MAAINFHSRTLFLLREGVPFEGQTAADDDDKKVDSHANNSIEDGHGQARTRDEKEPRKGLTQDTPGEEKVSQNDEQKMYTEIRNAKTKIRQVMFTTNSLVEATYRIL